jgi:hypothetical protein
MLAATTVTRELSRIVTKLAWVRSFNVLRCTTTRYISGWAANLELMIMKKRLKLKINYIYTITVLTTVQKYIKLVYIYADLLQVLINHVTIFRDVKYQVST